MIASLASQFQAIAAAAVVTLALNSYPQLVQIYRIVPPDSPELFGELLSLDAVWTLPVSERRRVPCGPAS